MDSSNPSFPKSVSSSKEPPSSKTINTSSCSGEFSGNHNHLKDILKNCPLTNLVGESSFGDLDFDIRRRPHCSNLKRSASHCIKRNKTASTYLDRKSPSMRTKLFYMARKKSRELVEQAKQHEAKVAVQIKEKMVENQNKLLNREIEQMTKEDEIKDKVKEVGV